MKVEYILNPNDWIALYRFQEILERRASPWQLRMNIVLPFVLYASVYSFGAVFVFWGMQWLLNHIEDRAAFPIAMGATVLYCFIVPIAILCDHANRVYEGNRWKRNSAKLKYQRALKARELDPAIRYAVTIGETGIFLATFQEAASQGVTTKVWYEIRIPWNVVGVIEENEKQVFITYCESGIICIPRREIEAAASVADFVKLAAHFANRPSSPSTPGPVPPSEALTISQPLLHNQRITESGAP